MVISRSEPVWANIGPGPHNAPKPWINLDVHEGDGVEPDVVVDDPMYPLAHYPDDSVARVYAGHVLEHIPWPQVRWFLADLHRAMVPGGELCIVGPDVLRVIQGWHDGNLPWELVESALETPWPYASPTTDGETWSCEEAWTNARHWWNCYEERVVWALGVAGFVDVTPEPMDSPELQLWPLTGDAGWQCAVRARK